MVVHRWDSIESHHCLSINSINQCCAKEYLGLRQWQFLGRSRPWLKTFRINFQTLYVMVLKWRFKVPPLLIILIKCINVICICLYIALIFTVYSFLYFMWRSLVVIHPVNVLLWYGNYCRLVVHAKLYFDYRESICMWFFSVDIVISFYSSWDYNTMLTAVPQYLTFFTCC